MVTIDDPRVFAPHPAATGAAWFELAAASLAAPSGARAEALDRALTLQLAERLTSGDGAAVAAALGAAPSAAIARHLWRRLLDGWREASRVPAGEQLAATLFAVPLVIVAGAESTAGAATARSIPGVLGAGERVTAILRDHGAIGGNREFALAGTLVAADALEVVRLPTLLQWQRQASGGAFAQRDLAPAPISLPPGQEGVHLRFLIGAALAAPTVDLLADAETRGWALPLARELANQLAQPGLTILPLPRAPAAPPLALQHGRAAQRSVGAQLFASNAIRRLRAAVGEPVAFISAHRCADAPGGGELRLSLSSVFDPRQAEGFRCPLYPGETANDVAAMLDDLLRDCRVGEVRVLAGVHADRDPATGLTLLFKPDSLAMDAGPALH